jgi:hypothetical protein
MIGYSKAFYELYGPKPIERKNKMNELTKELWGKAWNAYIGPDGVLDGKDADDFYEKFAEMIVKECASEVTRNEALNILEHFGVRE